MAHNSCMNVHVPPCSCIQVPLKYRPLNRELEINISLGFLGVTSQLSCTPSHHSSPSGHFPSVYRLVDQPEGSARPLPGQLTRL